MREGQLRLVENTYFYNSPNCGARQSRFQDSISNYVQSVVPPRDRMSTPATPRSIVMQYRCYVQILTDAACNAATPEAHPSINVRRALFDSEGCVCSSAGAQRVLPLDAAAKINEGAEGRGGHTQCSRYRGWSGPRASDVHLRKLKFKVDQGQRRGRGRIRGCERVPACAFRRAGYATEGGGRRLELGCIVAGTI